MATWASSNKANIGRMINIARNLLLTLVFTLLGCAANENALSPFGSYSPPKLETRTATGELPRSRYGNPESYVINGKRYYVLSSSLGYKERGIASWYGQKFHGRRTSSGEIYNMYQLTAAHKSLPLPTEVRVTNLENGKSLIVRVNDRGPFINSRIIDLSYAAARKLDMVEAGTVPVEVVALNTKPIQINKGLLTKNNKPSDKKMYLQAGAFSLRENALELARKLSESGMEKIFILKSSKREKTIFKVRIGPIEGPIAYDRALATLVNLNVKERQVIFDGST
ncbi:MAG: septal ring lytic transglycosylase RlpA family protein [Pseudomonadota bacterium]|nr:septal ring lytic transglycosylase RlpA family protein [Pseudomonadota bacterium]